MYSAFEKLHQEKKKHIIKVAVEEFVKNGFERTSTDTITSRAGISKGILFHYFKSKKNLYLYLVNHVKDLLSEKTVEVLKEAKSDDFFERVREVILLKQKITTPYHQETQFIMDAFTNPPELLKEELQKIISKHFETYQLDFLLKHVYIKELIDPDKLRDDISVDTVIRMTMFVAEQISHKAWNLYKNKSYEVLNNPASLIQEFEDYLKIIRYGVYK